MGRIVQRITGRFTRRWVLASSATLLAGLVYLGADPGVGSTGIPLILVIGQSYLDENSTFGPSTFTVAEQCSGGATCGFEASIDEEPDAVVDAVDNGTLGPRFQTRMVHRLVEDLDQEIVMIESPNGGTAVAAYDVAELTTELDVAAAWAAGRGEEICPRVLIENSGGYRDALDGRTFAQYTTDLATMMTTIEDHIAAQIAVPTPGYDSSCTNVKLIVNAGSAHFWGASGVARHPYADDFPGYGSGSADIAVAGQLYFAENGTDDLHPNNTGANAIGELYAHVVQHVLSTGDYRPLEPTSVQMLDADTVRVTFFVPCRESDTCAIAAPANPMSLNTTDVVAQQSSGVVTYGLHFYDNGSLVTPANAVTSVTFPDCPDTSCDAEFNFAGPPGSFDEISFADTGVVNSAVQPTNPSAGGSNISAARTDHCGTDTCADFAIGQVFQNVSPFIDDSNATFATFGNTSSLQWASNEPGLVDAVAMCAFVWWTPTNDEQTSILTQFNTTSGDLRFWLGRVDSGGGAITLPALGTSNPLGGFGRGRDYTTLLAAPTRGHLGFCFWNATIRLWRDGVVDDGTINGPLQTDLTVAGTPNNMLLPETVTQASLDEVIIFWYDVRPASQPISDNQAAQIYCGTRRPTDPDHPSTCAVVGQLQKSDLCAMANIGLVIDFEGNSPNPICGVMGNPTVNGTVTYTNY